MSEHELVAEMLNKLYGPKYCAYCDAVQPVQTYELDGSKFTRIDGTIVTSGFTGTYVCTVCYHTIAPTTQEER
jgi:hypothetical protein